MRLSVKNHNLVLDKDGNVWGWGSNSNYPMGNLGGKVKTVTKLNNISNVKQIAAGTEFSLFLKNDGTLWGVGKNDYGQLGQGDTETRSTPVQITDKTDFIKVSVGEVYSAAIASDGIYVWGGNPYGQLGNGTLNIRNLTPKKLEVSLENNEYFVDISAGIDFCLALTNLGNVYSWGDNANGQLAISVSNPRKPLKIETLSNISKISAGYKNALAVKDDGTVYGWGYGYDGQLGFSAGSEYTPIEVTTLGDADIKNISCGYDFSVALDYDGNIYTFGNNASGQLGVYISEVKRLDVSTIVTDVVIEGTDDEETASYSISAEAGEEYVICFLASEDGTYSIDTSDMTAGTVVMVYRDENFTTPYKQTSAGDTITVGVEAGSTAYIRFVNTNQISYNANISITKTSAVVEDNKTYYMVLYDSYCGVGDGLWPRYYGTNANQKFEYTKEFFVNYLKLFSNKKVAFAISLRDLDFDCEPVSNSDIGNDAPSLNYNKILEKNLIQKTIDGCESYYRKIIHNIVNAYNSLETNERPNEFPEIYLGTPHFNAYAISDTDKWAFAGAYLSAMNDIYNKLTTEYSDGLSSINETFIKGLYFGRENPDMREDGSPERICLEYISNFIHSKNKKLLWIPFTLGKPSSLSYIGKIANSGRYTASDGSTNDLFDIIAIQPGLYFYEVNSSTTDEEFTQTLDDLVMCLNSSQNAVYSNGSIVDGQKITNTNVTVEIEYDISLITGRRVEGNIRSTVTNKINRFLIIKDTFNDYINDAYTPICIYAGGPNEQNFVYSPGANANNYRHSDRNHLTLWYDGHMQPYSEFSSHLSDDDSSEGSYSGDLIYDITNGIINRVWSDSIIKFLGRSNL